MNNFFSFLMKPFLKYFLKLEKEINFIDPKADVVVKLKLLEDKNEIQMDVISWRKIEDFSKKRKFREILSFYSKHSAS